MNDKMNEGITTIYIVTWGSYSDYQIHSVWDNLPDAQRAAGDDGESHIEPYVLNSGQERDFIEWRAHIDKGTTIVVDDKASETHPPGLTEVEWRKTYMTPASGVWVGWGYGPSPEHARKNLSDAWAKAKAEREGLS